MTRDAILETYARRLAMDLGCQRLADNLKVQWNPRLRTTAGLACYRRRTIFLNPRLVAISGREVQRTLRHELAHFVAQERAGRRRIAPHGEEWRAACRDLGMPNEPRCHDLPFKRVQMTRRHFYQCRGCNTVLGRVRPVRRPIACLKCCRRHNGGKYDPRFRFVAVDHPETLAA